ncbi:MAG: DUF445 domain-containing protein [Parashewanella sp.]
MNKSLLTNLIAFIIVLSGYLLNQPLIWSIGIFALSGAITNWLAIHMLFEKVPGLYGSGVIPSRFEDFKSGISQLVMKQFFTQANIERFVGESSDDIQSLPLAAVIKKTDLSPAFDSLLETVEKSSFGGMLAMFGGVEALLPLKDPYIEKLKTALVDVVEGEDLQQLLADELKKSNTAVKLQSQIEQVVSQRLEELTPSMVKQIIQDMIRKHLGWLVVWGGVFGGAIGLVSAMII